MSKSIIDIENGGFQEDAGMVEIGMIICDEENNELARYSAIVQPYYMEDSEESMLYSLQSIQAHGITTQDQTDHGKEPVVIVQEMEALFEEYNVMEFVGHCIKTFDQPRLKKFFDRFSKYECDDRFPILTCTKEIAKEEFECDSYSLANLCDEFGITNSDPHRAMGDCEATLELLIKITADA